MNKRGATRNECRGKQTNVKRMRKTGQGVEKGVSERCEGEGEEQRDL